MAVYDWLFSLSMMFSRFIHVVECIRIPFLFKVNHIPFYIYSTLFFTHSWADGHLDYFHSGAIMNNVHVPVSVWMCVFNSLGYIPRSIIISGSYGNFTLNFLMNHQTLFHSSCTTLYSHKQFIRTPISPFPQYFLLNIFWVLVIPVGVKWDLIVGLICISLMINYVEYLFMYLLVICISSLMKCLFTSFTHFLTG